MLFVAKIVFFLPRTNQNSSFFHKEYFFPTLITILIPLFPSFFFPSDTSSEVLRSPLFRSLFPFFIPFFRVFSVFFAFFKKSC